MVTFQEDAEGGAGGEHAGRMALLDDELSNEGSEQAEAKEDEDDAELRAQATRRDAHWREEMRALQQSLHPHATGPRGGLGLKPTPLAMHLGVRPAAAQRRLMPNILGLSTFEKAYDLQCEADQARRRIASNRLAADGLTGRLSRARETVDADAAARGIAPPHISRQNPGHPSIAHEVFALKCQILSIGPRLVRCDSCMWHAVPAAKGGVARGPLSKELTLLARRSATQIQPVLLGAVEAAVN